MTLFIRNLIALSKLRVVSLLVLTAVCAMWKAEGGMPDLAVLAAIVFGGTLAASGSNSINQAIDRDIDSLMLRTRSRVVPSHKVSPKMAVLSGITMIIFAVALIALVANWTAGLLTLLAAIIYVFVYSIALKRTSWNNIVIGGGSGAFPPLIATAAVLGEIEIIGFYLFVFVFFWTPPHFWTLAVLLKDEYSAAGVPMLASISSLKETTFQICLYILLLGALCWLPFAIGFGGLTFAIVMSLMSFYWLLRSRKLKDPQPREEVFSAYRLSLLYLAVGFVIFCIEPHLPWY
ncbi:MAG: protoheme IX farnesyltransferase [Chloroflexi bacterium]|nr:protoheme IX farnesyltransferase [Chloroflexota bacterium]